MFDELKHAGRTLPVDERAEGQPFYLAVLEGVLQIAGGPDFICTWSKIGCRLRAPKSSYSLHCKKAVALVRSRI